MQFIMNIKEIPVKEARNAEMALLCGNQQDAEAILLQAGLIFRAIMLNIQLYNWDRSCSLCVNVVPVKLLFIDLIICYVDLVRSIFVKQKFALIIINR